MSDFQLVGPLVLFCLMMIVGLELTPADFRRVAEAPRAVVGGTLGQIVLLPLMTWGLVLWLDLPPVFGAGAVLVAVSPGAGISNILTALAGANIALSVTLTAIASILSVVTLPTIAALGMRLFLPETDSVSVPVVMLIGQLTVSLLLPIGLGMWIRLRWTELAFRHVRNLQRGALIAIALLITLAIVFGDGPELAFEDAQAGILGAVGWTFFAMAIGWCVALALRLSPDDRFTFLIEFSARNIAVATIVALSGLERLDLTLFAGAYVATGYPLCTLAVLLRRRLRSASPEP